MDEQKPEMLPALDPNDDDDDDRPRRRARALSRPGHWEHSLEAAYNPDEPIARSFYRKMEDCLPYFYVPLSVKGKACDPAVPHRIQMVEQAQDRRGRWRTQLREVRVETAADLRALAASPEYRRSRYFEATGDWIRGDLDPERYHRALMREVAVDGFEFGDDQGRGSGASVTRDMDDEFIPIIGGPYCFTGDTMVSLLDGTQRSMADLARDYAGTSFWVYSVTPEGRIVPGRAHSPACTARDVDLVEVTLDNGETVRCTPTHQWMLRDGSYRNADQLQPGDSLMPLYTKASEKGLPGYRLLYQPHLNRFVYEHKSFTGRIPKGHVVHHRNFNKQDNSPGNLEVMARADHQRLHMRAASWWDDPIKRQRASRALANARYNETPATRAKRSASGRREMASRKARGWKGWMEKRRGKGFLSDAHRDAVVNSPLRRQRTAEANKRRVWTPEMRAKVSAGLRRHFADNQLSEKAQAALDAGRAKRQAAIMNHKVVSVRRIGRADVYDFTVDTWHNFALAAGVFVHNSKQQYLYAHWEQTARAFYEKNHSELARAAINITTDFVLGTGISWKIKNERCRRVWEEFWERNDMHRRLRTWSDDLCLDGSTRIACLDGTHPTIAELAERNASTENPIWVYSYDHDTGRVVPGKAVRCWKQPKPKRCVTVLLDNGEEVIASHDHPFLLRSGQYVPAETLRPGDSLMPLYRKLKNGKYEKVWHPDGRGTRWQVTHHAMLGLEPDALRGSALSVHHRNGNKLDNRPGNLKIQSTASHIGDHAAKRWADPSTRQRMSDGLRAARSTPQGREQQRRNASRLWAVPSAKTAAIKAIKDAYATDDVRERHAEAVARTWSDPDVRRRRIEGIKAARARKKQPHNHKVVSVTDAGDRWVYDLSVEGYHNFAVAAGVFTHNTWQGELLIREDEPLQGFTRVRALDPSAVLEIVTNPEDIEQCLFYHYQAPTPYSLPYTQFKGRNINVPLQRYVIEQYPANEVHHVKINVSSGEKRGRSDFYASFGTLKRHRDAVNALTLKELLQANLIWIVTITGDQSDVDDFMANDANSQLPAFGGTWIQNSALKLEAAHQDVAGSSRLGAGSTPEYLTGLFATGMQMPATYFNSAGAGPARATALTQSEPHVKRITGRQQEIQQLLDRLYESVMRTAFARGRVTREDIARADPEWFFPPVYEEDRGAAFRDAQTALSLRVASHRTLATWMARPMRIDSYDYDKEQAEIAKDMQNPVLKSLYQAAPAPGAVPGQPGGQPPNGEDNLGPHEEIAGADERERFRREERDRPGPRTPGVIGYDGTAVNSERNGHA